jgi:hypothetical protein
MYASTATLPPYVAALRQLLRAPRVLVSQSHRLYFNNTMRRDYSSPGRTGSTSTMPCAATTRLPVARALPHALSRRSTSRRSCVRSLRLTARLLVVRIAPALLRLCRASGRAVSTLDFSSVGRTGSRRVPGHSIVRRDYPSRGRNRYTLPTLRVRVPRHVARLVIDYFDYAARPGASAHRAARRGSSRSSSRCSLSTTSTTPRFCVPQHVARLVTRLVAPLVVDFFAYAARSGASARRAACRRQL